MHPIVDGIEIEYGDKFFIYRLNYRNFETVSIARFYAIRTHPVLIVINANGTSVKRWDGFVSPVEIRDFLQHSFKRYNN